MRTSYVAAWMCVLVSANALAFDAPTAGSLAGVARGATALHRAEPSLAQPGVAARGAAPTRPAMERFLADAGGSWQVFWDDRSDRPNLVEGSGVPLVADGPVAAGDVEAAVRGFLARYPEIFRVDPASLRRIENATAAVGEHLWFVELGQLHQGVPVDGASVFFRLSHGRLVQFGTVRIADVRLDAQAEVARETARERALGPLAETPAQAELLDAGTLVILPVLPAGEQPGEAYAGTPGEGYEHRLVWRVKHRERGEAATIESLVDAHDGALLDSRDVNQYADATVTGGIYPQSQLDGATVVPFPWTNVTNGATKMTDAAGVYDYSGGDAVCTLDGRYIRVADTCGAISVADSTDGNLDFGTSGGTNCTTPGFGGAGNTHASRNAFYHLTRLNRLAAKYHPGNAWLSSKLSANVNLNQTCNAFWNGSTVNFYRSGDGCANTGEIADVMSHEWGHGFDTNTGGAAGEQASGEAFGDVMAMLAGRDGCIGENFQPGLDCFNCEQCTGVRDISDFDVDGPALVARPDTIASNSGINCDVWGCPFFGYLGPMGYEGHCESIIAGSAVWDLGLELRAALGDEAGWEKLEELWFASAIPAKSAYRVQSGGQCNPSATVDGCGAQNWYTVLRMVDDDDGNLANGTPNGCRIWDAFDAHGIACGSRPECHTGPTPTPTSTPTPTFTPTPTVTPTPTPTPTPTFTPTPTPTPTATPTPTPRLVHVGDLDGSSDRDLLKWNARVVVTVHDNAHGAVPGARVTGRWSRGTDSSSACTTGADGRCGMTSGAISHLTRDVLFTVTGVSLAGTGHEATAAHDPDGGDGRSIVVRR